MSIHLQCSNIAGGDRSACYANEKSAPRPTYSVQTLQVEIDQLDTQMRRERSQNEYPPAVFEHCRWSGGEKLGGVTDAKRATQPKKKIW